MEIDGWKNSGSALERDLVFENQTELAEFVLKVAQFSDEVNHHADMKISEWRKLHISITTHDAGGLTEKDLDWAKEFNRLLLRLSE